MIKAYKQKHRLEEMVHSRNLYGKEHDKEEQLCNPSLAIDMSRVCDEMLSYEEGDDNPRINIFLNLLHPGISPHEGGMCLFGHVKEKEDMHADAHEQGEVLVSEILSERVDVSLQNDSVGPFLRSFKYQPGISPEEGSSGQLSHEHMT